MRLNRVVHTEAQIVWGKASELLPDLRLQATAPGTAGNGNGEPQEMHALGFAEADGEAHFYIFSEQGRQALLQQLTGGIVIP